MSSSGNSGPKPLRKVLPRGRTVGPEYQGIDYAKIRAMPGFRDVKGFPSGHPQFRVTLVGDSPEKPNRIELGGNPAPMDRPGLKFPHKKHLDTKDKPVLGDRRVQDCSDCHKLEPGGLGFQAITYNGQCQRCHELTFDRADLPWPNAKVPHGDDVGVVAAVWNYYAGKALQGGLTETQGPRPGGHIDATPKPR